MSTVGVEIELVCPRDNRGMRELSDSYYGTDASDRLKAGWKIKSDGSIQPDSGYFGLEVVSPVLDAKVPMHMDDVIDVCDTLVTERCMPHDSCGMHVHVDARSMTRAEIDAAEQFFRVNEFAFYGVNGDGIEHRMISEHARDYCKPSPLWGSRSDRYRSLNMSNLGSESKNTLECRVWQSTLEPLIVIGAITMFHALVERAKAAVRTGTIIPLAGTDHRITSPVKAMGIFTDVYFNYPELLPAIDSDLLKEVKTALMAQARIAERRLEAL